MVQNAAMVILVVLLSILLYMGIWQERRDRMKYDEFVARKS